MPVVPLQRSCMHSHHSHIYLIINYVNPYKLRKFLVYVCPDPLPSCCLNPHIFLSTPKHEPELKLYAFNKLGNACAAYNPEAFCLILSFKYPQHLKNLWNNLLKAVRVLFFPTPLVIYTLHLIYILCFMFCWTCISIYACNKTNLMHRSSSVYWVTILLHVSGLLVAHHQEETMYSGTSANE
jgi:hypothetical protein